MPLRANDVLSFWKTPVGDGALDVPLSWGGDLFFKKVCKKGYEKGRIYPQKEIPVDEYFMTGDLYPDGVIDVFDMILLRKELIEQKFNHFGDVNDDRQMSVADLVMMKNHILGKEQFKITRKGEPPKSHRRYSKL